MNRFGCAPWMRLIGIGLLAVCTAIAARPAMAVELHAGDLVIVQTNYDPSTIGRVYRLDPVTLAPTPIGVTALAQGPMGIDIDHHGRILIADYTLGLLAVDASTATAATLASAAQLGGNARGVCASSSGDVFVSVSGASPGIVRVTAQGAVIPVTSGGSLQTPAGLTLGPDGGLYVAEMAVPNNGFAPFGATSHGSIVRVDPASGAQTLIAASSLFVAPFDILFNGPNEIWTAQAGSVAGREGCFVRTVLSTGASDRNITSSCRSRGMAVAADGGMVLSDCNTIGPDCYTPYTTRYPGGATLSGYGGLLALVPQDVVPVRRTSWGNLKTIYR